jgi:hypothetical protein
MSIDQTETVVAVVARRNEIATGSVRQKTVLLHCLSAVPALFEKQRKRVSDFC